MLLGVIMFLRRLSGSNVTLLSIIQFIVCTASQLRHRFVTSRVDILNLFPKNEIPTIYTNITHNVPLCGPWEYNHAMLGA